MVDAADKVPLAARTECETSLREIVELHRQWWQRTNTRPLIAPFVRMPVPFPGLDIAVPVGEIARRKQANAAAVRCVPGDVLRQQRVDYSVGFMPALAGAGFRYDDHTSWAVPVADRIGDVRIPRFDPTHPLFAEYQAKLEQLLGAWSWETFLPSHGTMLGPTDILSGLLGPQQLACDLCEHPEEVRRCALDAAVFVADVIEHELGLLRDAGFVEGTPGSFEVWLPGRGVLLSEDFTALIGPQHYQDVFAEADAYVYGRLDSVQLHVHSAALPCLDALMAVPGLGAIEISTDPRGPDLAARLAAAQRVQARGLPLHLDCWEFSLAPAELETSMRALQPQGLLFRPQTVSLAEAWRLYEQLR